MRLDALLLSAVFALAALAAGSSAHAQEAAPESALELSRRGARAYGSEQYGEAADYFERAFSLSGDAAMLYNLALAQQRANRVEAAIESYTAFLAARPEAPERTEVEVTLATLVRLRDAERARAEVRDAEVRDAEVRDAEPVPRVAPPTAAVPAVVTPPRAEVTPAPVVVAALGALGLGAATVVSALALDRDGAAVREPVQVTALRLAGERDDLALAANVLWVSAGLVTVAGVAWLVVELASPPPAEGAASARLTVRPFGASIDGSF